MIAFNLQLNTLVLVLQLLSALSPPPAHLSWAQRLLVDIQPQDNSYGSHPTVVQWRGVDGARRTFNRSVCSSFITALIRRAYGYSSDQIRYWLGARSPQAVDYYDAIARGNRFQPVLLIGAVEPGDLLATRNLRPAARNTGHLMLAAAQPQLVKPCDRQFCRYRLTVIDSSRSGHGPNDSRGKSSGVGIGVIELQADLAGRVHAFRWSELQRSQWRGSDAEPVLIGRFCDHGCGPSF